MYYILIFCLLSAPIYAEDIKFFDSQGLYQGQIKENGSIYDRQGKFTGRIHEDGRLTDEKGRYMGRVEREEKKDESR